jgi:hypothetical protein
VFYPNANSQIGINGSNFNETFTLLQFQFFIVPALDRITIRFTTQFGIFLLFFLFFLNSLHWGYNDYHGSEHEINYNKFPMEIHFVHKSTSGVLTVLGFLFVASELFFYFFFFASFIFSKSFEIQKIQWFCNAIFGIFSAQSIFIYSWLLLL